MQFHLECLPFCRVGLRDTLWPVGTLGHKQVVSSRHRRVMLAHLVFWGSDGWSLLAESTGPRRDCHNQCVEVEKHQKISSAHSSEWKPNSVLEFLRTCDTSSNLIETTSTRSFQGALIPAVTCKRGTKWKADTGPRLRPCRGRYHEIRERAY